MNKFHRLLLASGLAATASLMGNLAAFAQAVTGTTATVTLTGVISSNLTITVTPDNNATNLTLTPSSTTTAAKIATITAASTNSSNGLTVNVTSGSNFALRNGALSIPLTYIGEDSNVNATTFATVNSHTLPANSFPLYVTHSTSGGNAPSSSIFISYSVPSNQAPGTYTGSITFTAVDN